MCIIPVSSYGECVLFLEHPCCEIGIYHKFTHLRCRRLYALVSLFFRITRAITLLYNKPFLHVAHTIQLKQHCIVDVFFRQFHNLPCTNNIWRRFLAQYNVEIDLWIMYQARYLLSIIFHVSIVIRLSCFNECFSPILSTE